MASIDRTAYPRFSHPLSDQELDARYGPTDEETTLTLVKSLGTSARLTFLVMLKRRQQLGYFPVLNEVPEQIVGFLRGALDFSADTVLLDARVKTKTLFRYRDLIRAYLGSRGFSDGGQPLIESVIRSAALTMSDPADLINLAIETLTKANVELPAFSALDRVVGHLRQEVHVALYRSITAGLSREQSTILNAMLDVPPGENVSPFARLKESPGTATLHHIGEWADRLAELDVIIGPKAFLAGVAHTKIRQFAAEASRMQIGDLPDLTQPGKRHTLLMCFLFQVQAGTRDELVEMFLRRMRKNRHAAKDKLRALQEQHQSMEESLISVLGQVLDQAKDDCTDRDLGARLRGVLYAEGGIELLGAQVESVSAYHQGNYLPLLWQFHANHRSVLFRVLELIGLAPTTQDNALIDAWRYVLQHRRTHRATLPCEIDLSFLSQRWMAFVDTRDAPGSPALDRRALEVCVFTHIAAALQAGDLFVPGSAAYADYRAQLLPWDECTDRLQSYCGEVEIAVSGSALVADLRHQLNELAEKVETGFPTNSALSIDADGTPHLKIQRAKPPPEDLKVFREEVQARMPERHLLDVLKHVHHWIPYTRHFGPPSGSDPKLSDSVPRYLLGIKLFPRMRNWNDVIFYRPEKGCTYKHIDALFSKSIDWALIETHWQDMMQVVLSIQAGKILPSTLLRKLGSHSRQNRLNRAFRELGRVVRTLFLLRYISEADFRRSIRAETTRVESCNDFLDWVGFGGPVLKSDDPVEQAKQVKYMDLVANVIMLHNVHDLTGILADMEAEGWKLSREILAGLSPYMREHIRRFGRYLLDMEDLPPPLTLRTLRILENPA